MISLLALTIVMFGGGGFLMGQALADTWRPWWQILPYSALLAFRLTLARKMPAQYPWLYERAGPFHWRAKEFTKSNN